MMRIIRILSSAPTHTPLKRYLFFRGDLGMDGSGAHPESRQCEPCRVRTSGLNSRKALGKCPVRHTAENA